MESENESQDITLILMNDLGLQLYYMFYLIKLR